MIRIHSFIVATAIIGFLNHCGFVSAQEPVVNQPKSSQQETAILKSIVTEAFAETHDGWSSDEVVLQQKLNQAFIASCRTRLKAAESSSPSESKPSAGESKPSVGASGSKPSGGGSKGIEQKLNWTLLNLRKAGKLKTKTTRRSKSDTQAVAHIAEIVARSMHDQHQQSTDWIMCDPDLRKQFDAAATAIDANIDNYAVRKAAFQLRKARQLKPELITRIADWGRTVSQHSTAQIRADPKLINEHPGVYIFRDTTGYLYIGQTDNLRKRLQKHLDESHNAGLANYLKSNTTDPITIEVHDFAPKSQAKKVMVRRAYESELIASRKPRFNVQP